MILPTTMRALQARDATIYRVTIGAYVIPAGFFSPGNDRGQHPIPPRELKHPERWELFATRDGATRHACMFDTLSAAGVPVAVIRPVKARDYCQLTGAELTAERKAQIAIEHALTRQQDFKGHP